MKEEKKEERWVYRRKGRRDEDEEKGMRKG